MTTATPLVEPLSRLICRPLQWLWPGRLARGKLSMFDGDPELGKSLVTLDLCARITTGRPFPDGASLREPCNVLVLNAEDAPEDTVLPRLRALGADLDRVFHFHQRFFDESGPFRLPTHAPLLDRALSESRAVFAALDPIMAFLDPSIQVATDMSVRRALAPLAEMMDRHGCHATLVRHLNKSGHFRALYRGGGSIGLLAACRSAFLFARDPQDAARVVLAQIKNNLGPHQPSLAYRIVAGEDAQPTVQWLGQNPLGADQLLTAAGLRPPLPGPRDRARDFLFAVLEAGPQSTLAIWSAAQGKNLSRRTLQRVRVALKIRVKTIWVKDRLLTYWLLPGQKVPVPGGPPAADIPSLEPWLAPLREQYPTTPLDEEE
jgi:hypothetical protein